MFPSSHNSRRSHSPEVERIISLADNEELLIKVPAADYGGRSIEFTVLDGEADILGLPLQEAKLYSYGPGSSFSILAHGQNGCTLSFTKGGCRFIRKTIDPTTETTDKVLRSFAHELEDLRRLAESEHGRTGPIVCLAGPTDSGKSTTCCALLNYAVSHGRQPYYVDLDLGQGKLSVPGTFGAVVVDELIDGAGAASGDFTHFKKHAINYFVGSKSPGSLITQHNLIVSALVKAIREKMEEVPEVKSSGMIINSCGWVDGPGYHILKHIVDAFKTDFVLVMGDEPPNLLRKLREDFSSDVTKILPILKSELIEEKSYTFRRGERAKRAYQYFYSSTLNETTATATDLGLHGFNQVNGNSFEVRLSDVEIYKMSSAKPVTESSILTPVPTPSRAILLNQLLGVSKLESLVGIDNQMEALELRGYVCPIQLHQSKGTMTVVAPPGQPHFKRAVLLMSEIPLIDRGKK